MTRVSQFNATHHNTAAFADEHSAAQQEAPTVASGPAGDTAAPTPRADLRSSVERGAELLWAERNDLKRKLEELREAIITTHVYPPIPDRSCDWSAARVGRDGDPDSHDPIGRGATEAAAIADLLEQEADR